MIRARPGSLPAGGPVLGGLVERVVDGLLQ
jgi:hypothetical protein